MCLSRLTHKIYRRKIKRLCIILYKNSPYISRKICFPIIEKKSYRAIFPVYLRESAPFWAVDASCARERGGREGRGSPSTMSSPGSPSGSRGCCWESLYSFCRLPYHRDPYAINVNIFACDPDGNDEQSSSRMMFTALF